jgi:cytoskeletal protein CcmA (bactofilin family)
MWKKNDQTDEMESPSVNRIIQQNPSIPVVRESTQEGAVIGRSIKFRGDITGDEDLVIQGRVEGSVDLRQHAVTVGGDGEVIASIVGRVVTVEGRVEGNIDAGEQIVLRSSAYVRGDLTAPKVMLENGARFRGLVDMGEPDEGPAQRKRQDERSRDGAEARLSGSSAGVEATARASDSADLTGGANGKSKRPDQSEAQAPLTV